MGKTSPVTALEPGSGSIVETASNTTFYTLGDLSFPIPSDWKSELDETESGKTLVLILDADNRITIGQTVTEIDLSGENNLFASLMLEMIASEVVSSQGSGANVKPDKKIFQKRQARCCCFANK